MALNLSTFFLTNFEVSKSELIHLLHSWEFPAAAAQGIGCNVVSANDSTNFLAFLQTLRNQNGAEDLIITAAVWVLPFIGSDGNPITDVSEFAKVLDYIGPLFATFSFVFFWLELIRRDHGL